MQRIYEDNNEGNKDEETQAEAVDEDKIKEEKRGLMIERVKESLKFGFTVLDDAFEIVEEQVASPEG